MPRPALTDGGCDRPCRAIARCVMTTYDSETLEQDLKVLRCIGRELIGRFGLDCMVDKGGIIEKGANVLLDE